MKESLREKFNTVKTSVKQVWDKASDEEKAKIKQDIKSRNISGLVDTAKNSFGKGQAGKV